MTVRLAWDEGQTFYDLPTESHALDEALIDLLGKLLQKVMATFHAEDVLAAPSELLRAWLQGRVQNSAIDLSELNVNRAGVQTPLGLQLASEDRKDLELSLLLHLADRIPSLQHITLPQLCSQRMQGVAQAIRQLRLLTSLHLSHSKLDDVSSTDIWKLLQSLRALKVLSFVACSVELLDRTYIGPPADSPANAHAYTPFPFARAPILPSSNLHANVVEAFASLCCLQHFTLRDSSIGSEEGTHLLYRLADIRSLLSVDLSGNNIQYFRELNEVALILPARLWRLSLSGTCSPGSHANSTNSTGIWYLMRSPPSSLKVVDVMCTHLYENEQWGLCNALRCHSTLEELYTSDFNFTRVSLAPSWGREKQFIQRRCTRMASGKPNASQLTYLSRLNPALCVLTRTTPQAGHKEVDPPIRAQGRGPTSLRTCESSPLQISTPAGWERAAWQVVCLACQPCRCCMCCTFACRRRMWRRLCGSVPH
jgi:hypothetical protein